MKTVCGFLVAFGAAISLTIGTVSAKAVDPASVTTSADQVQPIQRPEKASGLVSICKAWEIIETQVPSDSTFCNCTPMKTGTRSRPSLRSAKRIFAHSC